MPLREQLIRVPDVAVSDAEYHRLLGYPAQHQPGARARELAAEARAWFATHGQPWIYLREVQVETAAAGPGPAGFGDPVQPPPVRLEGAAWPSDSVPRHLRRTDAQRAVVFAVCAGANVEAHARQLWDEGKPDEYFFFETLGSAVVEHLVTRTNDLLCHAAGAEGLFAVPHFSPGYFGWDVAEQGALFATLNARRALPFPEDLTVLSSGMLRPKKALLGLVGLSTQPSQAGTVPCERCALPRCDYRRAPYRFAGRSGAPAPSVPAVAASVLNSSDEARYSLNRRALAKWAAERVMLTRLPGGGMLARFRYDGTTCSNMGRPLSFEYLVALSSPADGQRILEAACRPAPGDEGHMAMCEYRRNPHALMAAIGGETPLIGQPLAAVLEWERPASPSGCYCDAPGRLHKWGLALETIHFAIAQDHATVFGSSPTPGAPANLRASA